MSYADDVNEKTKDIKPVTREEMFLQKIADNVSGGTGGGGADLLNEYGFLKKEVLPPNYGYGVMDEQLVSINPDSLTSTGHGTYVTTSKHFLEINVGQTYTINYNNVEYSCVAMDGGVVDESAANMGYAVFGDVSIVTGGESTGEPFYIMIVPSDADITIIVAPLDGAEITNLAFTGNAWIASPFKSTPIVLTSPNGTSYEITVDDNGTLSATAITE